VQILALKVRKGKMTITVINNNGKVETYPNAHISWEWDESEKGTDSGWRVQSMDKNCTHVSAFIYPRDCKEIKITHEKSDFIFESSHKEAGINGKRYRIFLEIDKERERQDNNYDIKNNALFNRFIEITKETEKEKNRQEMIKLAAVAVNIIENLGKKNDSTRT
jgi:hypothetical protein